MFYYGTNDRTVVHLSKKIRKGFLQIMTDKQYKKADTMVFPVVMVVMVGVALNMLGMVSTGDASRSAMVAMIASIIGVIVDVVVYVRMKGTKMCGIIMPTVAAVVYVIYLLTCDKTIYSKKFNVAMSLMTIITSALVMAMQANIVISLGMVGALSIVRFRTAIKEPKDLLFLFWSISNGIIIGAGLYSIVSPGKAITLLTNFSPLWGPLFIFIITISNDVLNKDIEKYMSKYNYIAYEKEETHPLPFRDVDDSLTVVIGPEGGFEKSEIEKLIQEGGLPVSLGKRILRTETAAITAVGMCMLYTEMSENE